MPTNSSKYPSGPTPGSNTFDWILEAAGQMRAQRRTIAAINKAQAEAAKRPRDKEATPTSRWKNKPSPWVSPEPAEVE